MSSESLAHPANDIHHPPAEEEPLYPPAAGFTDTPGERSSYGLPSNQSFNSSQPLNNNLQYQEQPATRPESALLADKEGTTAVADEPVDLQAGRSKPRPWPLIIGLGALALIIIIVAIAVPVALTHKHTSSSSSSSADNAGASSGGGKSGGGTTGTGSSSNPSNGPISGGYGSTITTDTGATFLYENQFGGVWYDDPKDPFNENAQAQSWTPPLNQTWQWGVDSVRGVNLGGWLVPEPFIVPALFEPYQNSSTPAIDEWTLSEALAADTANGGLAQLENHYNTFITEADFAQIASAGLNWVRLPLPFWAISKFPDEPFLEGVSWKYALKAFQWARKYGIRVNLDLHTIPGSQNGYDHSGKEGQVNWNYGPMGLANAQRALDYQRVIVEFISQKEYANLVPLFGVVNEPLVKTIGMDVMGSYYLQMHHVLRNITGIGAGNGPYLSIHDGFETLASWADFLPGKDRFALDDHPYMCFTDQDTSPLSEQTTRPCEQWASSFNTSWGAFGVTTAGEWALSWNDCGYWVNGMGAGSRWEGTLSSYSGPSAGAGACAEWNDWQSWDNSTKGYLQEMALASMDALQNWFFWTWKIGNSTVLGTVGAPFWSYSLGLENGWLPTDPRAAVGVCGGGSPAAPLQPSMTGGAGSGTFSEEVIAEYPWPASTIGPGGFAGTALPSYTQTGTPIPTLSMPTGSSDDGWFDAADTVPMYTPISGCTYLDAWDSETADLPPACNVGGTRKRARGLPALPKRTPDATY